MKKLLTIAILMGAMFALPNSAEAVDWVPRRLSVGGDASCFLSYNATGGNLWCWGPNTSGVVHADKLPRTTPVLIGTRNYIYVTVGGAHACALSGNALFCWGQNNRGQLGLGDNTERLSPTLVSNNIYFHMVSAGFEHTCTLYGTIDGSGNADIGCFGRGTDGQLGNNAFNDSTTLVNGFAQKAVQVESGGFHSCFVLQATSRSVRCTGDNLYGQIGDLTNIDRSIITQTKSIGGTLNPLTAVVFVEAGMYHTCVNNNTSASVKYQFYCWGRNNRGQIGGTGDRNYVPTTAPLVIPPGTSPLNKHFFTISAGDEHTCARHSGPGYGNWYQYCLGRNSERQLGLVGIDAFTDQTALRAMTEAYSGKTSYHSAGATITCAIYESSGAQYWLICHDNSQVSIWTPSYTVVKTYNY